MRSTELAGTPQPGRGTLPFSRGQAWSISNSGPQPLSKQCPGRGPTGLEIFQGPGKRPLVDGWDRVTADVGGDAPGIYTQVLIFSKGREGRLSVHRQNNL